MLPDPVSGLARRHGSIMQDEMLIASAGQRALSTVLADTLHHGVSQFFVGGVEYDLIYRTTEANNPGASSFMFCANKATGKFLPVVLDEANPTVQALMQGGVSAVTGIGKYVFIAGNTIVPSYVGTDAWGDVSNQSRATFWVRGGAYSRTFKITLTLNSGAIITAQYKTVSSSYPGSLDTSDIPVYKPDGVTVDPAYQKAVNDRVNAYNSAQIAWIGTAAADITPENIAQKLVASLAAQGVSATRVGGTVCVTDNRIVDVAGDDGGDGSLLRAVGNTVTAPELVSAVHLAGKIVKVRPTHSNGDNAFYLKATPKNPSATGFTDVTWTEAAGYVMQPSTVFVMGTVQNGVLYLAGSNTGLTALVGGTHPRFEPNAVGDMFTTPLPAFFGKRIDYLGVHQDRLIIGSGAVLMFSKPGDYFNWFRLSVLTVADNDPWEAYALGAEDDTITSSTTYERNLVLHGKRYWYEVSGRVPVNPKTSSITTGAAYKDANVAPPIVSGNYTLYAKYSGLPGKEKASLHQVQAGLVQDSPESTEVSQQLDDYLKGKPVQVTAIEAPNYVFLRTDSYRYGLYVYGYMDQLPSGTRVLDNWHRWEWNPLVGGVIGLSSRNQDLLVYTVKESAEGIWVACESFSLSSGVADYPYLDSLRKLSSIGTGFIKATGQFADACVAFENSSTLRFIGRRFAEREELDRYGNSGLLWVGHAFAGLVTPTNPFITDRNGRAILSGRLTLGRVRLTVENTGGFNVDVVASGLTRRVVDFDGRILRRPGNILGQQAITSTTVSVPIGKEVRECSYTITSRDWLPLTVTAIEWEGQFFNNVSRV